jgi:hypothetical protein
MNIKKIVVKSKYKKVAFSCDTFSDLRDFIDLACSQMSFSKSMSKESFINDIVFKEDKQYILDNYFTYLDPNYKSYALIDYKKYGRCGHEFQFYMRTQKNWNYFGYTDWKEYEVINFTKYLRKEKLMKLKNL